MKSPFEINTITNESSTKFSSVTNQVTKSSNTNNDCDQFSMKSPSVFTTNNDESYIKLPPSNNQVSESKSPDPTLINNNDLKYQH